MKLKKIITGLIAACTALSITAASAFAYDVNKDFKTGWSINTTIPASEFEELTENSVITITYTADASLAEKADHSYWVVKPMINDAGWPFISDVTCGAGIVLSESGDSYALDVDGTRAQFCITGDSIEHLKTAGMALMGHGITLETLTIDNNAALEASPAEAEETVEETEEAAVEETEAPEAEEAFPAETEAAAAETEAADNETETAPVSDNTTEMPVTGNSSAAAAAAVLTAAAVTMTVSKKK